MPDSPLLQRPRHRFVAFSAVGAAMVCLPLWQVLRYQQSDLHQLAAERALLDPVAKAVHVQFGLLAHRQVAAQLLQGHAQLEPARQAVQAGVDGQLQLLTQHLAQGLWSHAWAETQDLTRDWQTLAQQVKALALSAAQSDDAHGLRVEQAVQVVDLVSMADGMSDSSGAPQVPGTHNGFAHLARQLSRLAADMQRATATATATTTTTAEGRADTRLAQAQQLHRLQGLQAVVASAVAATHPLATAWAEVSRTHRLVQAAQANIGGLRVSTEERAEHVRTLTQSLAAAHQAQLALFNQALGQHQRALLLRHNHLQRQQLVLMAALALLSATALALAAGLLRHVAAPPAPWGRGPQPNSRGALAASNTASAWKAAQPGMPSSPTKLEALSLFSRLRGGGGGGGGDSKPNGLNSGINSSPKQPSSDHPHNQVGGGRFEPEDSLPPERG